MEKAQEFYVATAVTSHTRSANPRDFISRMRTRSQAAVRHIQKEPSDRPGEDPLSDPDDVDGEVYEYEEAVQHSNEMARNDRARTRTARWRSLGTTTLQESPSSGTHGTLHYTQTRLAAGTRAHTAMEEQDTTGISGTGTRKALR